MRAWGQAFRIPTAGRGRAQASIRMSCQPIAGYEREIFSAGCTMNIGLKKLLREVASTFSGAQQVYQGRQAAKQLCNGLHRFPPLTLASRTRSSDKKPMEIKTSNM